MLCIHFFAINNSLIIIEVINIILLGNTPHTLSNLMSSKAESSSWYKSSIDHCPIVVISNKWYNTSVPARNLSRVCCQEIQYDVDAFYVHNITNTIITTFSAVPYFEIWIITVI